MGRDASEGADVFELQFYPNCPVGFCRVWGTSLAEVLEQAQAIFQSEGGAS